MEIVCMRMAGTMSRGRFPSRLSQPRTVVTSRPRLFPSRIIVAFIRAAVILVAITRLA
jgi:hypothetical protein